MLIAKNALIKRTCTGLLLALLLLCLFFYQPVLLSFVFAGMFFYVAFYELPPLLTWTRSWLVRAFLFFFVCSSFLMLIALNQSSERILLLILFSMVFAFDSASYLVGSLWGKTLLYPAVTPRKTWEGFFGGMIFGIFFLFLLIHLLGGSFHSGLAPLALFLYLAAFLGDFFESYLKRQAKIKDTGNLLPGHGGILDRFDSIFFLSYFFFFFRLSLLALFGLK